MPLTPASPSTPALPPVGLANAGSNCWWNAFIQMLLSLKKFTEVVLKYRRYLVKNSPLAAGYIKILDECMRGDKRPDVISRLHLELLELFTQELKNLGGTLLRATNNECMHEALVFFIDTIKFEPIERLFTRVYENKATCSHCNVTYTSPYDRNMFTVFYPPLKIPGITVNSTQAEKEKAWDEATLTFAMRMRVSVQETDEYTCPECKEKSYKILRTSKLHAINEIITIMFPQFGATRNLNFFPESWRLQRIIHVDTIHGKQAVAQGWYRYKLRCMLMHIGTMDSGHHQIICERAVDSHLAAASRAAAAADATGQTTAYFKINDSIVTGGERIRASPQIHLVVYELEAIDEQ